MAAKRKSAKAKTAKSTKQPKSKKQRRLVVIDGANAVFRAFFGIPGLRAPDGTPSNAVLGFANILNKLIRDEAPDFIVVAMDPKGGSFRNQMYSEYKANRDATPEDLSVQFPIVRDLIDAFQIPCIEVPGFEADDVIATLVRSAPDDVLISIISTDKDLMQLCTDRVELVDGIKDRRFGPAEVVEKFGVPPDQMLDLRALVGDPSDNIPGVKGIGVKGAAKLISEWGTLENLLAHAEEVTGKRAREGLLEHADLAVLSKELSTLREDVVLGVEFDALAATGPDLEKLSALYRRLGFTRLLENLGVGDDRDDGSGEADRKADAPGAGEAAAAVELEVVRDLERLRKRASELAKADSLLVWVVEGVGSVVDAQVVGVAISPETGEEGIYLPIASAPATEQFVNDCE